MRFGPLNRIEMAGEEPLRGEPEYQVERIDVGEGIAIPIASPHGDEVRHVAKERSEDVSRQGGLGLGKPDHK